MTDVADIGSTTGICSGATAMFSPLVSKSFFGWVNSLSDLSFSLTSLCPDVLRRWCPYFYRWELLFYGSCFDMPVNFGHFRVCHSLPVVCCDVCAFSTHLEKHSRTLLGSIYVGSSNGWSVLVVSATMVKFICCTLSLSCWFNALWRILVALCTFMLGPSFKRLGIILCCLHLKL